jgi:NACHT domain
LVQAQGVQTLKPLREIYHELDKVKADAAEKHAEFLRAFQRSEWTGKEASDVSHLSKLLFIESKKDHETSQQLQILERLSFHEMANRHETISIAHKQTFEWVFREKTGVLDSKSLPDKSTSFYSVAQWLENDHSLYWVTGKPGAGKSTFMKFLYDDHRTRSGLYRWCGSFSLQTAAFFFWNSGSKMQMSRIGLLQTLLHQLLNHAPHHIPACFPKRWKRTQLFGTDMEPFTWTELSKALEFLTSDLQSRYCFFIDGLDEFDGDHDEMTDFIIKLGVRPNMKICVASRPWAIFQDKFHNQPTLQIQELTERDIQIFVSQKLHQSNQFCNLETLMPREAQKLIDEVVFRAEGVFLWANLVVKSLLDGLWAGDNLSDLRHRLFALPADLEKLFDKLLTSLDPPAFEQVSKWFQMIRLMKIMYTNSLTLYLAKYSLREAMEATIIPHSETELQFIDDCMTKRFSSKCRGFLEVTAPLKNSIWFRRVTYLHRTIKDYLEKPQIRKAIINATSGSDFDPGEAIAAAALLHVKRWWPSELTSRETNTATVTMTVKREALKHLWGMIQFGIDQLGIASRLSLHQKVRYIEEMDRSCHQVFIRSAPHKIASVQDQGHHYWAFTNLPGDAEYYPIGMICEIHPFREHIANQHHYAGSLRFANILELCFYTGNLWYVRFKLEEDPSLAMRGLRGGPLLHEACRYGILPMIEFLLGNGGNPNSVFGESSAWGIFLENIIFDHWTSNVNQRRRVFNEAIKCMELLLQHGSNILIETSTGRADIRIQNWIAEIESRHDIAQDEIDRLILLVQSAVEPAMTPSKQKTKIWDRFTPRMNFKLFPAK